MDRESLEQIKEQLDAVADMAYKGNVMEAMAAMSQIIPKLELAAVGMDDETRQRMIDDALLPIMDAMESQDGTMLADIITYELLEILDSVERTE